MTQTKTFQGIIPAVPTPFYENKLDLNSMKEFLQYLKSAGVHGIVLSGTTGEGPTVTQTELTALFKCARDVLGSEIPIICGVGTNSTATTIERTQMAAELGADGLLVVVPYYNKPPQEGLYQHFKLVAESTQLPIVLYNVPGRTSCNILPATVARLAKLSNIVAIKEASGSLAQAMEVVEQCGDEITLLSGEDLIFLPLMSVGCQGVITVLGNVVPKEMVAMYNAFQQGDVNTAKEIAYKTKALCEALFCETNPIPVKAALYEMGIFRSAETRPPLCSMSSAGLERLQRALIELDLTRSARRS